MRQIKIDGATTELTPDDRPSIGVFGHEGTGKTRFACTAPDPIGLLALDKKSKRTFDAVSREMGKVVVANAKPFMTDKEARDMAVLDDSDKSVAQVKATYTEVIKRVYEMGAKFAEDPQIQTIVVDTNSQMFDWILFAHFGRKNQLKPTSRGGANQDMIDFVNVLRSKNLILIHRAKEIWKDTGKFDKEGSPIQAPSGKFEQDGYRNIGGFLTVNCELISKPQAKDYAEKFRMKLRKCQTQAGVLLEGQDLEPYGISGESITYDNLLTVIGLGV